MLRNVAALVFDGAAPFELGIMCEAFGIDRSAHGVPVLDFDVCSTGGAPVRTSMGFMVSPEHGLERLAEADLVAIPALPIGTAVPPEAIEAIRAAHARGARLLSACSGAFVLAAAGLLDGIEATTHWMYTEELQRRHPEVRVVPEVLYVDAGQIVTSAGSAAGLDAALHIWRQEYGAAVANAVARRAVVPPYRDGGQSQFIARPVPDCTAETLGPLLTWITENLAEDLDVQTLARRATMSPRTFARRFKEETGATPHAWVTRQRLNAAEELLEAGTSSVDHVAQQVGFANAATLRHQFAKGRGTTPSAYRRAFAPQVVEAST